MKLSSFNYLLKQGVGGIGKNRLMSFASFCIMLVSLLMVGLSVLTTMNVNRIINGIEDKNEVVIIIKDDISQEAIDTLGTQIKNTPNVKDVVFYSKVEAWKALKENLPVEQQEIFKYGDDKDDNPLPDSYRIRVENISNISFTSSKISAYQNVDSVKVPTDFADLLVNIRKIATVISSVLLIALVTVCLVIISNTTRTSVFTRRKEINIMKYVGATNGFIRIPFFIEGLVLGAIASGGALLITKYAYDQLYITLTSNYTLQTLFGTGSIVPFNDILIYVAGAYLSAGILLGAFGTVLSTKKHLKV